MQITLNPSTPAEVRLLAAFMQGLADHLENTQQAPINVAVAPEPQPEAAPEKPKRSRKAKEENDVPPTEPGTQSATTAEAPAESGSKDPAPVEETSSEIPGDLDHDKLRVLFGELSNAGKRQEGINAVTNLGFKSIKDIPDEKLADAWKAMKAVLA